MVEKADLRRVPAFADLPDDQLDWFLGNSQELHVAPGDTYIRQGDPADWMFVLLEGQFQWRGGVGGGTCQKSPKARARPRPFPLLPLHNDPCTISAPPHRPR